MLEVLHAKMLNVTFLPCSWSAWCPLLTFGTVIVSQFVSHYNAWKHLPSVKKQYVELSADHQFSVFFWFVVKAVFKHLVDNRYWNLFLWVKNNVSVSVFLSTFRKMSTILVILGNKMRANLSNQAFLKTLPSRFCKFTVLSFLFLSAIAEQVADAYTRWWK